MRTYELLCVDCAEALTVGKIVQSGPPATAWSTTGWRDLSSGEWLQGEKQWLLVETFLILHRCHELRVLPELVIDSIDPDADVITSVHDPTELLSRRVQPEPHAEEDVARLTADAFQRIKRQVQAFPKAGDNGTSKRSV